MAGHANMSTASSGQRLTTTDALTYLKTVKEIFQDKRDKYNEFLEVMKDFKALRINTSGVILKVKELFKGNRDLILGFNSFLPKGYEITLPPDDEFIQRKKPVEFEEAMSFVNKIKERFQGDDHLYKAFLNILNMYKKDCKSITDVYHEVSILFEDHYDLLVEFTHFLPDVSGATSRNCPQPVRNSQLGDDRSYLMTPTKSFQVEKDAKFSERERQNKVEKPRETREERKSEWERIDSSEHKRSTVHPTDPSHQGVLDPEASFHEKVKEELQDTESYEKILDCIRSYRSKICSAAQFRKLVASLIGRHTNLVVACEDFITHIEKTGGVLHNRSVFRSPKVNDEGGGHEREDKHENSDQDQKEREKLDRGVSFTTKDIHGAKLPPYGGREKLMMKSIQDLDLSNCESCTPSYRRLPDNYSIPSASHRTEVGDEVLNDHWVSVTSGSEDYSFKHMRKNQYEESLFRCEDDRFELDMLLESVNATARCVEELVNQMNDSNKMDNDYFFIEEHLTALNLRCIERLYGDHGLDVIDVLRKNAPLALPVILIRLKQKQEEWARCRADFNKVWGEIYFRNYHKSLDHRSFYFKQQDTKNLSAKALLADIKEMSDKNQNEEEMMLFMGAGFKHPIGSQMEFEYSDPDIQEDLYQLIKYASGEVCTPEQREKVMIIWSLFLEPVLGLPVHPPCGEEKNAADTANNHNFRSVGHGGDENDGAAGEIACSKTTEVSGNGADQVQKGLDSSCRINNVHYNDNRASVVASFGTDTIPGKGDLMCNPHQNGDSKITKVWDREQAAILTEGTKNTTVEEGMIDDDTRGGLTGPDSTAKVDEGQGEATAARITQDSITTILNLPSFSVVHEEVKVKEYHQETEACSKTEKEGYRSSPDKKLEVGSFTGVGNTCVKVAQAPSRSARYSEGTRMEETEVPDDDVDESVQVSTDSENASENADISASESANGEGRSPNDPCDEVENDNKVESEAETDSINDVHETEAAASGKVLQAVKPLVLDVPRVLRCADKKAWVFYGNDSFYILFRLHQMLYERMQSAKFHSLSHEHKWKILNDTHPADPFARFKDALHSLLNGSSDSAKFEDECRAIIGAQSYILFTLDKLIYKLIKQMQTIGTEEIDTKLLQLYKYETSRSSATFSDAVYHENARFLIPDDNLYRIEYFPCSKRMTIQLMKNDHDKLEPPAVCMDPGFASYLNNELLSVVPNRKENPGIYLKRLKRKLCPGDENSAALKYMEGIVLINGLEMKFTCNKKASFVLDTTDVLHRVGKRKRLCLQTTPSVQPSDLKE